MEFQDLVLEKIEFIIEKYNLSVVEKRKDHLELQSQYIIFGISYNNRERSTTLFVTKKDGKNFSIEINNVVLSSFFYSDLKLSEVPVDVFINNLVLFFEGVGKPLLEDNIGLMDELEGYTLDKGRSYAEDVLKRQKLQQIDAAWGNNDYREFILLMDEVDINTLPQSYGLKYKYAQKKISS